MVRLILFTVFVVIIVTCLYVTSIYAAGITKQQVERAINGVRKGDYQFYDELVSKDAKNLLPYLTSYVRDSNPDVKIAIIDCARRVQNKESITLLISMLADKDADVSERVASAIFSDFKPALLCTANTEILINNLQSHLQINENSGISIILLAQCKKDKAIIKYLNKYRVEHKDFSTRIELWHPKASLSVSCDIALAELGDADAMKRYQNTLKNGKVENLIYTLYSVRWISRKEMLFGLLQMLRDNRNALPGGPSGTNVYQRICDISLENLLARANIPLKTIAEEKINYSARELNAAINKLGKLWKK